MTAPTPQIDAERVQGEVTAAVRRAAEAIRTSVIDTPTEKAARIMARAGLGAVLGVEEMVGVLASHAAWRSYGQHGYGLECSCGVDLGEHSMAVNANDVHQRHQAEALRAAILGGAA